MASRRAALDLPVERPVTILVVDDDARVVELLEIAFGANGWRVVRATDGDQALRLASHERPDLVVLDVRLPKRSGLDVCEALRRDPIAADLPVIMVSAMAETDARIQGFARGADDYLAKPFSPKELVARIRRLLVRSREARDARRFGIEAEVELGRARDDAQRQHQELRHAQRVRETTAALAHDLARAEDREQMASSFLLALDAQIRTGLSGLWLPSADSANFEPVATRGCGSERLLDLVVARDGELARLVGGLGRVMRILELGRFSELEDERRALEAAGVTLLAPVLGMGQLEGLLLLDDRTDGADLTRAEIDQLHAWLVELAAHLAQQRRLDAQSGSIERMFQTLADAASDADLATRTEAAAWIAAVARERSGSSRMARDAATVVRLGEWCRRAEAAPMIGAAATDDPTGHFARVVTLARAAADAMRDDEMARLVRAGSAWVAARVAGADRATARDRAIACLPFDQALADALRRSAPGDGAARRPQPVSTRRA